MGFDFCDFINNVRFEVLKSVVNVDHTSKKELNYEASKMENSLHNEQPNDHSTSEQ